MKYTLLHINPGEWPLTNIQIPETILKYLTLKKDESKEILQKEDGWIFFFLLKGICEITLEKKETFFLKESHCILLPVGKKAMLYACRESFLIFFYLPFSTSYYGNVQQKNYLSLSFCPALQQFFHFTYLLLEDGRMGYGWMELKIKELFFLLKSSYSKEELEPFTRLLNPYNLHFRKLMWQALETAENVSDLLKISGMKRTTFEKKFRKEFGLSPYQLLLQNKAMRVKNALAGSRVSVKEVSRNCGFNSATHFIRFCRQKFGETPRQMRKNHSLSLSYK